MTNYIYESKGMECPECGEVTNQLFNAEAKNGQSVLLCEACKPTEDKTWRYDSGWVRGGLNE
tara:strand:- start:827 stop:1012 length:186 start_codon:yes stop_codon:yes gene_type:complete